jgi:WD40 repeat protein
MVAKSGVFISYARKDGGALATKIRERLISEEPGLRVWQDRTDIEGGIGWWRQIEEALNKVEFLVIIMTGSALESEVMVKEWRYARQQGVCVYPVKGPDFELEDDRLPRWMSKLHIYDLEQQWDIFLEHLKRGCQRARVPFMAPDLPKNFIQRNDVFESLRSLLIDSNIRNPISIGTSLVGTGGFGKTTLAAAICHDDDILLTYDDGVLWTTLGQTPNLVDALGKLYAGLTGDRPPFKDVEDASQALAEKLDYKNCLIVIDDVWEVTHLEPFLRGGAGCSRLITSRQREVAYDMSYVVVDEMKSDEAVTMLTSRLDGQLTDLSPIRKLAHRLGEWPLLLKLAGSTLVERIKRGDTPERAIEYISKALDRNGITAFDRKSETDRHTAVATTIGASLVLLDPEVRKLCADLAIFPEDKAIPVSLIAELWNLDEFAAESIIEILDRASLIELDLRTGLVRMHDIMRAYFSAQLGSEITAVHRRLLQAWPDLTNLPHHYAWHHIGYHLIAAGDEKSLCDLLLNVKWLNCKILTTNIASLLADFELVSHNSSLNFLHHTLRLSSHVLSKDKGQLANQLLGRLPDSAEHLRKACFDLNQEANRPWLQPLFPSLSSPDGALIQTFDAGVGPLCALTVLPDGKRMVSGASSGAVSVWDIEKGVLLCEWGGKSELLEGNATPFAGSGSDIAATPDSKVLLATSRGLSLWIPNDLAGPKSHIAVKEGVMSLALSRDGTRVLTGTKKGGLYLWDIDQRELILQLPGHRSAVMTVSLTPDNQLAISGGYDKSVKLWDINTRTLIDNLSPPHEGVVYATAISPDGTMAITASGDRKLRVWNLKTGTAIGELIGHKHRVYAVVIAPDGKHAISGSHDRTVKLWNLESMEVLRTFVGHSDAVYAVSLSCDARFAFSASFDGTVKAWRLDAMQARSFTQQHDGGIHAVAMTNAGELVATAGQDHVIRLWDVSTAQVIGSLKGHHDTVSCLSIATANDRMLSGSHDGSLIVWDLTEFKPLQVFEGRGGQSVITISAGGETALAGSLDGDLILLDLKHGRIVRQWQAHRRNINFVAVTPDREFFFSGSGDGTLKIWQADNFNCILTLNAHHDGITAGTLAEDGTVLLTGGADGTIRVWSFPSGTLLRTVAFHTAKIRTLQLVGEQQWVISGGYDRYLHVWPLSKGLSIASFIIDSAVMAATSKKNGEITVVGDALGCVHFLCLRT